MVGRMWSILKDVVLGCVEDKAPRLGAALAFYSILALAPLVILVTPVATLMLGQQAQKGVTGELNQLLGPQGTDALRTVLEQVRYSFRPGPAARTLGIFVLLFGASGVFVELQDALDTIWEVAAKPPKKALFAYLRQRVVSFAMVLGTGFLLIVSLLLSAVLSRLRQMAAEHLLDVAWVWTLASDVVSFAIVTLLFALIFRVLPDVNVRWRPAWVGAVLTSLLFSAGRFVIGTYLGKASVGTAYGAAGSIVVLLVWVYYSAQILYLGAEFTKVYSRQTHTPAEPSEIAVPVTDEARAQQGITKQEVVEAVAEVVQKKADEP